MGLKLEFYSNIHIGLKRKNNQDALLVNKEQNIASVADGLGGHLGGEVASSMALDSFNECIMEMHLNKNSTAGSKPSPEDILRKSFIQANQDVLNQSKKHEELRGMGTTLVAAWIFQKKVYIGNVGDSRCYLYREGRLWQLTDDHTFETAETKQGFDKQDIPNYKRSSVLTQSIGFVKDVHVDICTRDTEEGDIYLLCSDGLHGMVSDHVILEVLQSQELKDVPFRCTIKALSAGGWDNISVIAVKVASCG